MKIYLFRLFKIKLNKYLQSAQFYKIIILKYVVFIFLFLVLFLEHLTLLNIKYLQIFVAG